MTKLILTTQSKILFPLSLICPWFCSSICSYITLRNFIMKIAKDLSTMCVILFRHLGGVRQCPRLEYFLVFLKDYFLVCKFQNHITISSFWDQPMCAWKGAPPQNWWDKRGMGLIDLIKCDVRKKAFISSFRNAAAIKWIEFASCSLKLLQTVQKSKFSLGNVNSI